MKNYRYEDKDFFVEQTGCILNIHYQNLTGYVGPEISDEHPTGKFAFASEQQGTTKDGVTTPSFVNLDIQKVIDECCRCLIQQQKEDKAKQKASIEQACQTIQSWVNSLPTPAETSNE